MTKPAALAALCLLGCRPEFEPSESDVLPFAAELCRATSECCEPPGETCEQDVVDRVLSWERDVGAKLTYSKTCFDEVVAWSKQLGCERSLELQGPGCDVAHGEGSIGDECEFFGEIGLFGTTCADGLQCLGGRCVNSPFDATHAAGEGENCGVFTPCEDGFFCAGDETCRRRVGPGESCTEAAACTSPAQMFCDGHEDGAGTCTQKSGLDESCDGDESCAFHCDDAGACEQLRCTDGRCARRGPAVCGDY